MAPASAWAAAAGRIAALESAIAVLRTMAVSLMVFRVNFDILGSPNSSSFESETGPFREDLVSCVTTPDIDLPWASLRYL
jgi:hypothetical protein